MSDETMIEPGSRWLRKSDREAPAAFVERLAGGCVEFVNRGGLQVSLRRESFLAMYEPEPADESDPVDNPPHYKGTAVEPIDAIEAWGLGFNLGNAVKYIARAGRKGDRLEDLEKSLWYLQREIEKGARS